jgi:hypothetical protein
MMAETEAKMVGREQTGAGGGVVSVMAGVGEGAEGAGEMPTTEEAAM